MFDLNAIGKIINNLLRGPIDSFKMKSPGAFTIIASLLFGSVVGVTWGLEQTIIVDVEGVETVMDAIQGKIRNVLEWVRTAMVAIGFALGAHTPEPEKEQST